MKKRIVFVGLCMLLLLIFTSLSYGEYDPKYREKADPWDDLLLFPARDTVDAQILMLPLGCNTTIFLIIRGPLSSNGVGRNNSNMSAKRWTDNYTETQSRRIHQR
jgi:hypothetical protein